MIISWGKQIVILNEITQDNNKVLKDESSKTVKLHGLEIFMEKAVSMFQSLVKVEQWNGGPYQKLPLAENGNTYSSSNQEQEMDQAIKGQKVVERQPITISVDSKVDICVEGVPKQQDSQYINSLDMSWNHVGVYVWRFSEPAQECGFYLTQNQKSVFGP